MTTPPVPSITDEQLAEIEAAAIDVKGWTMREHFQEPEEGFLPEDWEWYVGAIDEEGNRYPLLNVNAHQYDSGDSEKLAKYYALVNRDAMLALITRLRAAEAERNAQRRQVDTLTEWYSNSLDVINEITAALPGVHYMDPPDGGDVSVPEQVHRMAKDAERYRLLRDGAGWPAVFASHDAPEPLRGADLDTAMERNP